MRERGRELEREREGGSWRERERGGGGELVTMIYGEAETGGA
jgi:hypothetical protein